MAKQTTTHTTRAALTAVAIAACSYVVAAQSAVPGAAALPEGMVLLQVTPAGEFGPSDGRALPNPLWRMDAASAQGVIARFTALTQPPVIDYEHQTLNKEKNGQPAPAAGWIRELRWIDGQGLYAVAELTARAKAHIDGREYLYFSPVFEYDPKTGTVLAVHMGALTNNPAIHGMDPLSLMAAATAAFIVPTIHQEPSVNPLLKAILEALGLPETTTETAACAALSAVGPIATLKAQADAARQALALPADASADAVVTACTSLRTAAAPAAPDPAKYVPVAVVDELRTNIAVLTARQRDIDIDDQVKPALADGRLLPAQEVWARDLGKTNLAALTAYLATAQPIAALSGPQTGGKPPAASGAGQGTQLSAAELAVCSAMGITADQYRAAATATAAA